MMAVESEADLLREIGHHTRDCSWSMVRQQTKP